MHNNHPHTHRQHGSEMEVRAEILEALHSAAAEVDEVSTEDTIEGKSWRGRTSLRQDNVGATVQGREGELKAGNDKWDKGGRVVTGSPYEREHFAAQENQLMTTSPQIHPLPSSLPKPTPTPTPHTQHSCKEKTNHNKSGSTTLPVTWKPHHRPPTPTPRPAQPLPPAPSSSSSPLSSSSGPSSQSSPKS